MKKSILLTLVLILIASVCLFAACNNDNESSAPTDSESEILTDGGSDAGSENSSKEGELTIIKSALTLKRYESALLYCTKTNIAAEAEIIWTSSDEETVSVGQDGMIFALKAGVATVTAKAGEYEAKCVVTVVETDVVPSITTDYSDIFVNMGDSFVVSAFVKWGADEDITTSSEFEWLTEDNEIISIVKGENGSATVNGLKAGETEITVIATVRGKEAVGTISVKINPVYVSFEVLNDDYKLAENGYAVELYTVSAGTGENKTQTLPSLKATFKGAEITDYVMNWSVVEGADAVKLGDNGSITAKLPGTARIKGVTNYNGLDTEIIFNVTVKRSEVALGDKTIALNKTGNVQVDVITDEEQFAELIIGDVSSENVYGAQEKKITVPFADFEIADKRGAAIGATVRTELIDYKFNINVIDFEIGTKEEFFGWYKNYKANVTKYIVLAADIDFGGADLGNAITDYWWASDWNDPVSKQNICFEGVFDGGDHVLSNFTASVPVFSGIKAGAEIKNLSMIDYTVGQYGLIACSMYGGTIEDCYFEGTLVKTTGHKAAMFDNLNGGTIKNVSVVAHDYEGDKLPSVANSIEPVTINDLYIVDYATNGTIASKDASADKTVYLYEDMNTGFESLPAAFNADAWTLYNGVVVTKSAAAYYNAYTDGLTFAINALSVKLNDEVKISAKLGDAEENGAVWTIEGLTDGQYTFENGMFCVTDESALGTVVTVKASVIKKGLIRFAAQTAFTVEKQDKQVVELGESVLAGKNRSADYTVTLDENQVFVALYVDDVAVENTVGIDGVTATILNAALNNLSVGSHAIKLETESIVYKFNVNVVDFALGTAEEFDDWYQTKYSANLSAYVVLTDNISLGWTSAFANNYSGHFEGTFDGCGYAVDGFYTSSYGFIPYLFGTLKNVAFTNVKLTNPGVGFMGHQTGGTVSDVYYQGEQTGPNVAGSQSVGSFYTWTLGNPSVKNLVISVTRVCGADSDAFSRSRYANIENIYVANNSSIGNTVTTGVNYYASHTEMKSAVAELPAGFGDMWTIDPYVGLTMKSAVGNYSVKWSEETTFMSSISSDTYMSSQAHADMVTEEGTLNGLKVYGIALTDYTANKTFMSWRSLGFSQFNFAVKTSVEQKLFQGILKIEADTWTYLVFRKESDNKIHCYRSTDKYFGYSEVALGGYTGWCGNTADMIRFGVAGTFNAYFTDIFTVA